MRKRLPVRTTFRPSRLPPKRNWWRWLCLAFLVVLALLFIKGWQVVNSSLWDGRSRLNFVLASKEVVLASFDPYEQELLLLVIPEGTQLEVVHGYGKYRVDAVGRLGGQEKISGLLAGSLQENFGVVVDGWISTFSQEWKTSDRKSLLRNVLQERIFDSRTTNFSRWDLVRLWWSVKNLRFDRLKTIDLAKTNILKQEQLADKTRVYVIEASSLDVYLSRLFFDTTLRKEKLSIEILNATNKPGLAERASRIVGNIGGEVVWVGNYETQSEKCKVQSAKEKKDSYTVRKLMKVFACLWEEKGEEGRGDISLLLGEDYWQKLDQK